MPRPLVIAHRGASGHRPEHTLEAYRLAVEMGADYIEPDLVSTKDGVLIARHDNELSATTDAAEKFPSRASWLAQDFTLAEVRTLRARERVAARSHEFDGQFQVPTFDEVVELAIELGRARSRPVGIYPETKHPSHFRSIGLPLEEPLLKSLAAHNLDARDAPVFIQSFEPGNLRALRAKTGVKLVQLVSAPEHVTDAALDFIAEYADGIGPEKGLVVPASAEGVVGAPTDLVSRAHARKLFVHVWTVRTNAPLEFRLFRDAGVDGVFTDFPDVGVAAYQ